MSGHCNGTQTGVRTNGNGKLAPCGWRLQVRADPELPYVTLGYFETRDEADAIAYQALTRARSRDFAGAEVLITPIRRDEMHHTWQNPMTGYTLELAWKHAGGDLYLTHADRATVHKHYDWWQRTEAEADAGVLCEALDLDVPVAEVA